MANIKELKLNIRTQLALEASGIKTIEQLISKSENDLLLIDGIGRKSYNEIINKLESCPLAIEYLQLQIKKLEEKLSRIKNKIKSYE